MAHSELNWEMTRLYRRADKGVFTKKAKKDRRIVT